MDRTSRGGRCRLGRLQSLPRTVAGRRRRRRRCQSRRVPRRCGMAGGHRNGHRDGSPVRMLGTDALGSCRDSRPRWCCSCVGRRSCVAVGAPAHRSTAHRARAMVRQPFPDAVDMEQVSARELFGGAHALAADGAVVVVLRQVAACRVGKSACNVHATRPPPPHTTTEKPRAVGLSTCVSAPSAEGSQRTPAPAGSLSQPHDRTVLRGTARQPCTSATESSVRATT